MSRRGRVEEVERVARRRRVDDDDVELLGVDELVELLHRHVLLGARQRAGQVLVERLAEDRLRLLGRAGVALDEVVEGPLGVEHQGVEVAGPVARHFRGRVGQRLHAQGVGQAAGRVHGDHAGAPAGPGRRQGEGGRHGRLAHAARPAAHDDRALGHQLGQRRRRFPPVSPAAAPGPPSAPAASATELTARPRRPVRCTAPASASASAAVSAGPMDGGVERRRRAGGAAAARGARRSTCSAETAWRARRKRRASSSAARWPGATLSATARGGGHLRGRPVQPDRLGVAGVDDDRARAARPPCPRGCRPTRSSRRPAAPRAG